MAQISEANEQRDGTDPSGSIGAPSAKDGTATPSATVGQEAVSPQATEQRLRASERRLQVALAASRLVTWEWHVSEDRITNSAGLAELYGLPALATAAEGFALMWPEDAPAHLAKVRRVAQAGGEYVSEFRITRPEDGRLVWLEERATAFTDPAGQVEQVVGITLDITERKRAEAHRLFLDQVSQELVRASSSLDVMQRVAALVGAYFGVDHCAFLEFDLAADSAAVRVDWRANPDARDFVGDYPIASLMNDEFRQQLRAGVATAVADVATDPRTAAWIENYRLFQVRALVNAPHLSDGDLRAALTLYRYEPYQWPADEIELLREIAARAWFAIERRRVEEALRASEEQYRALVELSAHMIWMLEADGRVSFVSQTWTAYTGVELDVLQQRGWLDVLHPDDRERISAEFVQAMARGDAYEMELRLRASDGSYRWHLTRARPIIESGRLLRWLGITVDIDERMQAEEQLRLSEAQFRLMADTLPLLFWSTDAEGQVGFLNQRWYDYSGTAQEPTTAAEVAARSVHPDDAPQLMAVFGEAIRSGRGFAFEQRNRAASGEYRWFLNLGEPYRDAHSGAVIRWFGVGIEIDDRKRLEQALRASEARQVFLLQLSDLLRSLVEPAAIQFAAASALGQYLGATRVGYAEAQPDGETVVVTRNYTAGVPGIEGRYRYDDYGPELLRAFRAGQTVVRPDIANDPSLSAEEKAAHAVLQLGATVNVPIVTAGRLLGVLFMHQNSARAWTTDEVTLLEEVATRTWEAVERARAEGALRASEERYRTLLDRIEQGFCRFEMLYDDQGVPVDYRFLEVNSTFERHTGLQNAVGKTALELVPGLEPFWFETYGRVAATGAPARFEQGSAVMGRLFEVEAVRVGPAERREVAVVFTDVTERRRTEARLAAAAARDQYLVRLADALRPLSDAVAVERMATQVLGEQLGADRVVYFTIQGEEYVVERDHSVGVPSLLGRHLVASFGPALESAFRAGRVVVAPDVDADATLSPAERAAFAGIQVGAHVSVPLVKDGQFVAGLSVQIVVPRDWTRDEVTLVEETAERTWASIERARAEARLQALFAQEQAARKAAEEANRLKDEFLATVSHELRTPLTAFLGYTGLLQRRQRDAAYVARTVEKMAQSAKAQAALIEDLLDMSRIVSGKLRIEPALIDLSDVVHAAVDTVRPSLDARQQELRLTLDPAASGVYGDANRLQQVVWNLLSNAAKFSPTGATVAVELVRVGEEAELAVRDSGQGIDPAFLPYVFDRFRQADSTSQRLHGGLGLGLAIVRHLVELHGGRVAVASAGLNQGATFTVRLPLASLVEREELRPPPEANAVRDDSPPLRGLRVLVVDDQPLVLELLEELLTADGATVQGCNTAREALALLEQWQPDLLVSDVAMPGEDGYWLIEQLRRRPAAAGGELPAVALTAYVRMEDRLRVLDAGFQQYVTKPVDADELRAVILHLVNGERLSSL